MTATRVRIVGDFDPNFVPHTATVDAIEHVAAAIDLAVDVEWVPTPALESDLAPILESHGVWVAPGSPYKSMAGALRAIRHCRESGLPLLGTCGGFQHVVVEYARHVLGFADAQHAEYDPYASELFISELACSLAGQRMRVSIRKDTKAAEFYGSLRAEEEYYCNFGLNPAHQDRLEAGGLQVAGTDEDGEARILELPGHPFFLATLFVPPLSSTPARPHPLIRAFLAAASRSARSQRQE